MHINEIDLYYKTRESLSEMISWPKGEPEMTPFESAFLCGVLRKFTPNKILEVGVAAGGTSAIISSCMSELCSDFQLHSIDYYEQFYRDDTKKTGYLGIETDKKLMNQYQYVHKYWYGNVACSFIDEIGGDIDCLILDTVHSLPGEILDFLTLLPYLKNGCVLILHDLVYNHYEQFNLKQAYSNILLFSTIKGEKYINFDDSRKMGMPSIGAVVIDDVTREAIGDVFMALLVTWRYMPTSNQLQVYREYVRENYAEELCRIFDASIELNEADIIVKNQMYEFPFYYLPPKCRIILYGAGVVGQAFIMQIKKKEGIKVIRWIDADADNMGIFGIDNIDVIKDIMPEEYDYIVIAIDNKDLASNIESDLEKMGVNRDKIYWKNPRIG